MLARGVVLPTATIDKPSLRTRVSLVTPHAGLAVVPVAAVRDRRAVQPLELRHLPWLQLLPVDDDVAPLRAALRAAQRKQRRRGKGRGEAGEEIVVHGTFRMRYPERARSPVARPLLGALPRYNPPPHAAEGFGVLLERLQDRADRFDDAFDLSTLDDERRAQRDDVGGE